MNILCYGDSNTWGYVPNINGYSKDAVIEQYSKSDMWWHELGKNHNVTVNALCGRCVAHENKWSKGRNALETIIQDINECGNIDLVIILLGTNDCKSMYGDSAEEICSNLSVLADIIKDKTNAKIMLISPPKIVENAKITAKYYVGAEEKSIKLNALYANLAKERGFAFVSGLDLEIGEDGEHFTKIGHKKLGKMVAKKINTLNQIKEHKIVEGVKYE